MGRAVVEIDNVEVAPLLPCRVTDVVVKEEVAPVGSPETESAMALLYTG